MRSLRAGIVFLIAAAAGIVLGLAVATAYEIMEVTDETMAPTYRKGSHVLVELSVSEDGSFARGDVVLFENQLYKETGEGKIMLKRIVGLPGESIAITDGQVYIDGQMLEEEYASARGTGSDYFERRIPEDAYFVLGDNRGFSTDSRDETVGTVREDEIMGKVIKKW